MTASLRIGSHTPLLLPRVVVLLVFVLVVFCLVLIVVRNDSSDVVNYCLKLGNVVVGFTLPTGTAIGF